MKRYGKLINGVVEYAPQMVKIDKEVIINPNGEILKSMGYKEVVENTPEYVQGIEYTFEWIEQNGKIVKVWTESAIQAEQQVGLEERVSALEMALLEIGESLYGGL